MFRIPSFYEDTPTFEDAWKTIAFCGNDDALAGMRIYEFQVGRALCIRG